jgi:hypothetical protein
MTDKETTQNIKFTINGKFEINAEYERPINPEQTGIDESQFGLGNQELWLKRNFPKMETNDSPAAEIQLPLNFG